MPSELTGGIFLSPGRYLFLAYSEALLFCGSFHLTATMKKLLLALLAFAALYYLQSCGCKGCEGELGGLVINSFPSAANYQWVYQVTNDSTGVMDTATFIITSEASTNSDSTVYKTQTKVGNTVVDSGTLLQTPNSFTYRPSGTQSLFEYLKLVYPILINGSWQGYYTGDSLHVIAADITQQVLNSTYPNVYELSRSYIPPGIYAVTATVYLAPNVGIIQEQITIYNGAGGNTSRTIKLINYSF